MDVSKQGSLVDVDWVKARADKPGFVLLDATLPPVGVVPRVDTHARYLQQHLPGAVFFDIDALSDKDTPLPHMLPSAEQFAHDISALGISDTDTIVVYEQEGVFSAPRAWWMLRAFGVRDVHVLQGGLRAWMEAGLPVESGPTHRQPAAFRATLQPDAVTSFAQLETLLKQGSQVLDARSAGRFRGAAPEPRPGISSGHMPHAINLPYTELVLDGRLKTADELRSVFAAHGIALDQPITTTCGSGVTAAVLALGLEVCGANQVSLYDGSWAEYATVPDAVIETD